jgi:hypothetical protein
MEYKEYTFTKVWKDNNNAAGKRPATVIVKAYQNGVYVTSIELNKENGWTAKRTLMSKNGDIEYEWTIKEENVPAGYYATHDQETLTVTNTYGKAPISFDGTSPSTGDSNNLALWFALAGLAGMCLASVVIFGKKTSDSRDEE